MKFSGHWSHIILYAVFTGLAQVAGALGNGPQQALGEEVELQRLKRRASPTIEDGGSLMPKKVLVDPDLGEESPLEKVVVAEKTRKEKPLFTHPVFKHPVKENLSKDKDPIEESFSQVFPSAQNSGMQTGFFQELPGFSQGLSQDPLWQSDSHSGFSQSPGPSESLSQAALYKGVSRKKSLKGDLHSGISGRGEKNDAHKSKQSSFKSSSPKSSSGSSPKSTSGSSHKSSSQGSHKFSSQSVKNSKRSQEVSIPHFRSSQMLFSQTSDSQGSNTQGSNTQGSNTQGSNTQGSNTRGSNTGGSNTQGSNTQGSNTQKSSTHKSNTHKSNNHRSKTHSSNTQGSSTQMSSSKVSSSQSSLVFDSQAYRIPRLQSEHGEDELARKTAFLMGSFAMSVMEGGAMMLREYLQAANKGNNSG